MKNQISLKRLPHSPAASVRACWLKNHHPRRAPDTQGEDVLGHVMLTPALNNMICALCCITMDAQFSWKGFYFLMATCPLQVSLCCPWSEISELWRAVIISFLTFCNPHFSFSYSHDRFSQYWRFSYILTMIELDFALCSSSGYILLFPGLCLFLYSTPC